MKLVDRLLQKIGLMRVSEYEREHASWMTIFKHTVLTTGVIEQTNSALMRQNADLQKRIREVSLCLAQRDVAPIEAMSRALEYLRYDAKALAIEELLKALSAIRKAEEINATY